MFVKRFVGLKMVNLPVIKPEDEGSIAVCDADGDETLPADTLAILTEFLREKALIESNEIGRTDSEQMFGENWVGCITINVTSFECIRR